MKLGIDIDGVLAEFNTAFKKFFPRIPDDFVPDVWDWPKKYGATDEEIEEAWDILRDSSDFWRRLSPYPEMAEQSKVINDLSADGHEIYFITAREGWCAKFETETWLRRHGIAFPTVILSSSGYRKGDICSALDLHAMLDDSLDNVRVISNVCRTYLLDRPWNQQEDVTCVTRVTSISQYWAEVGV